MEETVVQPRGETKGDANCNDEGKRESVYRAQEGLEKILTTKKPREIVIQTDGNGIFLTKNETAGKLELIALLQTLLDYLKTK